jgi:phosphopantothenoylcysteine decarboxylase
MAADATAAVPAASSAAPQGGAERPRILLCCSGSVAAIKCRQLREALSAVGQVRVVLTEHAAQFASEAEAEGALRDAQEWSTWKKMGDPVLHIELRKWADALVVAPLSANTLAKLAHGLADNLLTCVARAWDLRRPFVVAPAMNTLMWTHPFTERHLASLRSLGVVVVPPVAQVLACGDEGVGAMAPVADVVHAVEAALASAAHDKSEPR